MANIAGVVIEGLVKLTDPTTVTFVQQQMAIDGSANLSDFLARFLAERVTDLQSQSSANITAAAAKRKTTVIKGT